MGNFVYKYYVAHLQQFKLFTSPEAFEKGFEVNNNIWNAFTAFAATDSISLIDLTAADKRYLQQRLKSLFARQQWRNEGYYEVNNASDNMIKSALEELEK